MFVARLVAYFRPLIDAKPLGVGKIDISLLQWQTRIDENSEAWNNTFVHPDSTHWLIDGPRLPIPGLSLRTGISKKMDVGIYWTTNPNANYSIAGAQLQYNFPEKNEWSAASRITWSTIYGPADLTFSTYGIDVVGSHRFKVYSDRIFVSPYANLSLLLSSAQERTRALDLKDENVLGAQAAVGLLAEIYWFRLGVEYNQGATNTISMKVGGAVNLCSRP